MADLASGCARPTRALLEQLLSTLEPIASRLGSQAALLRAREMVEVNGALAQRRVARSGGMRAVVGWLVERFLG